MISLTNVKFFVAVALLLLFSCKKDDVRVTCDEPFLSITFNGKTKEIKPDFSFNTKYDSTINQTQFKCHLRFKDWDISPVEEFVIFKSFPLKEGKNSLWVGDVEPYLQNAHYYHIHGGDVLSYEFQLDPDKINHMTIDALDEENQRVRGHFEMNVSVYKKASWNYLENNHIQILGEFCTDY